MARKKIEEGWREQAGLEQRRRKAKKADEVYIDPRQMTIWDILGPDGKGLDVQPAAPVSSVVDEVLGDFNKTVDTPAGA
jgi:hypothetical protein